MKRLAILLLIVFLPAAAIAEDEFEDQVELDGETVTLREGREKPRSCRVIARQIAHFEDVAQMARDRNDELWEQGTEKHLDNLLFQQARKCPQDVPPSQAERAAALLKFLGRAALTAASFGAF